jgi:hypothetical protein
MTQNPIDPGKGDNTGAEKVVTGTTGAPNPNSGSADAARGLGGHSKDASHEKGAPAGFVERGKPAKPE